MSRLAGPPANPLRGEFDACVAGTQHRFNTSLGTIATMENRCGDASMVDIVNRVVSGRRARDFRALIAAALVASGQPPEAAERSAEQASLGEAEAFVLALMAALGFEIAPRRDGGDVPLDGASSGGAGDSSPSVP